MFTKMSDISYNFAGKHVLVVGGSRGIGKSTMLQFLKSGANVYCASRVSPKQEGVNWVQCDIRNERDIHSLFSYIDRKTNKLDFVINVAGTNLCAPIEDINSKEWDRVLDTNLRSFFLICKEAVSRMKKHGYGRIVNVSSIAGRNKSIVSGVHYTSSKAGIIGLTKQLAHEVAKDDILVNAVCPSQTMTEMLRDSMDEEQIKELSKKIPIQRIASVDEQSLPILFLCSSAASYISGTTLDINGGQL